DVYDITMKGDSAVSIEKTAGIAPEQLREMSVLADAYPLYQRDAAAVYAAEQAQVTGHATMEWFE
ncbi:MAG TPA: hypothetical protein VHV83_18155, partial [Armatimonadota bacterium]|nr:hypothetical protein [Armatimonadota bacterium]